MTRRPWLRPLIDNLFDIGVVVLVTMLLAFEVMLLVMTINFTQPAQAAMNVLHSVASGRFDRVTGYAGSGVAGHLHQPPRQSGPDNRKAGGHGACERHANRR